MVFGFAKKDRRVPDLSRYDYYYQNQQDYNRSHRLSAAAAASATNSRSMTFSNAGSMQRSYSMAYSSDVYNQHQRESAAAKSMTTDKRRIVSSASSNNVRRPLSHLQNSPAKRSYSLKTSSSYNDLKANINNQKIRAINNQKRKSATTAIPNNKNTTSRKVSTNNKNKTINNIHSKPKNKRLNSLSSPVNNSRLNSMNSMHSLNSRNKAKKNMHNEPQSRTNSITTRVTRVTDEQGRTKSITKKVTKRIDGYEYIETTTTTTNIIPIDEEENQKHFDEFSDNFITDNNSDLNSDLFIQQHNIEPVYEDEIENDDHDNNDGNNGSLRELTDEEDHDISNDGTGGLEDLDDNNMDIVSFENPYLDDVTEEDEEEVQNDEPEQGNNDDSDQEEKQEKVLPKQFSHPYASNLIPLDQTSSVSKFSDALDYKPSSTDSLPKRSLTNEKSPEVKTGLRKNIAPSSPVVSSKNPVSSSPTGTNTANASTNTTTTTQATQRVVKSKPIQRPQQQQNVVEKSVVKKHTQHMVAPQLHQQTQQQQPQYESEQQYRSQQYLPQQHYQQQQQQQTQQQQQQQTQQPRQQPLSDQEMYLKALEVAKRKVYSNNYSDHSTEKHRDDSRSNMGSRMTLRNGSASPQIGHNAIPTPAQKQHSKFFSSSLFSKNKHEAVRPIVTASPPQPPSSGTFNNQNNSRTHSIIQQSQQPSQQQQQQQHHHQQQQQQQQQHQQQQEKQRGKATEIPIKSKNNLTDEQMYAKALEIAQKRYADAHQQSLQQQQQYDQQKEKERENLIKQKADKAIDDTDIVLPSTSNTTESDFKLTMDELRPNRPKKTAMSNTIVINDSSVKEQVTDMSSSNVINPKVTHEEHQPESAVKSQMQADELLTATPEQPFDSENVKELPTLESLKKGKKNRHHRDTDAEVQKGKSKFKNMFSKVVQFSQENSGYQPSKQEKIILKERKRVRERSEVEKFEEIQAEKINPPALEELTNVPSLHGASTTLPVQQSLNHFPKGIADTISASSYEKLKSEMKPPTTNHNTTRSSSIFSGSRKQDKESITPNEVHSHTESQGISSPQLPPQTFQDAPLEINPDVTATTINTTVNSAPLTNVGDNTSAQITNPGSKISNIETHQKGKNGIFTKLFKKRSKHSDK